MNAELMLDVGQANELKLAFRREGWNNENIKALCERRGILKQIRDILEDRAQIIPMSKDDIFTLKVDYTQSLEDMIRAGCYDWRSDKIARHRFVINGKGEEELEAKLFHFGRNISSEYTRSLIQDSGWEPARIEHLLTFRIMHREKQHRYPVVALGCVMGFSDEDFIPAIDRVGSGSGITLFLLRSVWESHRFLAVRKKVA